MGIIGFDLDGYGLARVLQYTFSDGNLPSIGNCSLASENLRNNMVASNTDMRTSSTKAN